jgi:O-antigen/teichoic acid export membrane protein
MIRSHSMTHPQLKVSDRHLAMGAAVMATVNFVKIGIQFAMLPIMARLLGPEAYGLYALALPTVTFVLMVADGGLGSSLARERPEARSVWSSAFWAVHALALILICCVIGWSLLLAEITRQPQLPALMFVLSFTLLFLASGVLPMARLLRHGQLHVGAIADLVATVVGAGLGIFLAVRGCGAWALVGQYVATFALRAFIVNAVAFELPSFTFDFGLLRPHFLMGGSIVGIKLSDYFGRMMENVLISSMLGANTLGIYGFANQIPRFVCESASNPFWAILYIQAVHKPLDAVVRVYYQFCRALGIVLFPTTMLAAVTSSPIIALCLGTAWHSAALPLSIILVTSTVQIFGGLAGALLYAKGRGDLLLRLGVGLTVGRVLAVLTAGWLGLTGVAAMLGVINVAYGLVAVIGPARAIGVSPRLLLSGLRVPLGCAGLSAAACSILLNMFGSEAAGLIIALLVSFVLYVGLLAILEHRRLISDIEAIRVLLRGRPAT